ncbi:MAG: hypothetical protein KF889_28115 [Alphaproteobacteria bacterium]|nr:hypothetical protein [Alphaproteobacteria bacterium]MCW5743821.1 hypothetical protein [Alphaproteobacteria bacterium]
MLKYWNTRPGEPPTYDVNFCPWFAPAMAVATAVISAAGTIASAQASAAQAGYQAQVARNNQIIAQRNAADALKRGEVEEDKVRQRTASIMGQQRARLAGQGSALDEGSPLDIQMDTAGMGTLDALTVRGNFRREAHAHEVQAMNHAAQAALHDTRARTSMLDTYLRAGGSILGAAGSAFGGGKIQNGIGFGSTRAFR